MYGILHKKVAYTECIADLSELKRRLLENVAINDVLPLKAARRCAVDNVECFGAPGHQQPNFDGCVYIRYAAPPYSARISAIYLLLFGKVRLGCAC